MKRVRARHALLVVTTAGRALADDECGRPNLIDAYPPPGASGVPANAQLTAHYAATAEYDGEAVTLERDGDTIETLDATFDRSQGLLEATPSQPLARGQYAVVWPALKGVGTASVGTRATIAFSASDGIDRDSPTFEGLEKIFWDVDRRHDGCTGSVEERFFFDLTPGAASDDFPTELLSLNVFQTKGPGMASGDAPLPVAIAPFPPAGYSTRVERSIADGSGGVCFAALLRDLAGHVSAGAEREVCVKTTPPPFFYGCQMSPMRNATPGVCVGVLALSFLARRRHRRDP